MPSLSLIIAVYNKPQILGFVLAACGRQSFHDFEAIVADDGSGPETALAVEAAQARYRFPIIHLWHEDRGWRKNVMLNNGIRAASADYLVFIDGDCLPSRHFLLDHWNERQRGKVLLGRRVETSARWSGLLTMEDITSGAFEHVGWRELTDGLRGRSLRVEDGVRITSPLLRKVLLRTVGGMLGSNFSVAKDALEEINGFDEAYDGPGCGEDSDVQHRLSLIGVTGKSLRNLAIQYHVHHPLQQISRKSLERFTAVKTMQNPRCNAGLRNLG